MSSCPDPSRLWVNQKSPAPPKRHMKQSFCRALLRLLLDALFHLVAPLDQKFAQYPQWLGRPKAHQIRSKPKLCRLIYLLFPRDQLHTLQQVWHNLIIQKYSGLRSSSAVSGGSEAGLGRNGCRRTIAIGIAHGGNLWFRCDLDGRGGRGR